MNHLTNSATTSASTSTSTLEIKLLGQRIALKSSETNPEMIQQVLQLVTAKLSEAENRSRGAPPHQVALLALLSLAEEYIQAKERTQDFKQQMNDQTDQLLGLIEAEFK